MRVLIIEDEPLAAEKLQHILQKLDQDIEILAVLETVEESINWFTGHPEPDLVFMDIQLDDGICFEIFESVKISAPIIFTTAYDEYAIRAFKVNSVDYLLKPVSPEDLAVSLNKFRNIFPGKAEQEKKISHLYDQLVKNYKTRFFVKLGNHFHSVSVKDIACFYIQERGTFIKTLVGKNFDIDYSLDQVQKLLDPIQFFRINRNYIINLDSITDIINYSSSRLKIILKNFEHLEDLIVSRDKTADFKQWLDR